MLPPLQDTLAVISNIRSLGHLNASGASRSGLRTDIDMVCAGLSVGEALRVLRGIFLPPPPCQCPVLDMALGEAGSLYLGAALPDLLSTDTPRDPCLQALFPKACLPRTLVATFSCIMPSLFSSKRTNGWVYRARSQAHLSLYVCAVAVTVGKCGA